MRKFIATVAIIYGILIIGIMWAFIYASNKRNAKIENLIEPPIEYTLKTKPINRWYKFLADKYKADYGFVNELSTVVIKHCKYHRISSNHIMSMIGVESNFRPDVDSRLGAEYGRGLCQVSEKALLEYNWHNEFGDIYESKDLYNYEINIKVACWYYARLRDHYKKGPNFGDIFSAYNRGPYDKKYATNYVNKINENLMEL